MWVWQTARTYDKEYKKKLLTILGIESRVFCHPPDGMSSVRYLRCADAQGIKVKFSTLKPPGVLFRRVSTAKHQHVNTLPRIPTVFKVTGLSIRCSAAMHISVHTTRVSWVISSVFHSQHNDYSSQNTTNCPPSGEEEILTHHPHYTLWLVVTSYLVVWRIDALRASDALCEMPATHSGVITQA